ncbi:MAG: hypothetical protein LBM92_06940, partial [Opitutaceae bacterium]|nr:hypothetical protein [Opitutaceae bacterium]
GETPPARGAHVFHPWDFVLFIPLRFFWDLSVWDLGFFIRRIIAHLINEAASRHSRLDRRRRAFGGARVPHAARRASHFEAHR